MFTPPVLVTWCLSSHLTPLTRNWLPSSAAFLEGLTDMCSWRPLSTYCTVDLRFIYWFPEIQSFYTKEQQPLTCSHLFAKSNNLRGQLGSMYVPLLAEIKFSVNLNCYFNIYSKSFSVFCFFWKKKPEHGLVCAFNVFFKICRKPDNRRNGFTFNIKRGKVTALENMFLQKDSMADSF